ncbi:MAG TPA: preprotein translocase subunit SecG [Prolixibacteraceae bacterium]|nr:MAG: preprotein translocase subunit SecG [Bacteroidetes bacterium GWB2_41_8]HCY43745.1 preprotein translocase subunit SecG [Prolixibacteraceae bacterium]
MYTLITVLLFITCILLILIVLVQNSKGGGLASNFQASNQMMGVRKTTDFLEKATWVLAGALLFFSIMGSAFIPRGAETGDQSVLKDKIENAVDPNQVPSFPAADAPAAPATSTAAPDSTK